MEKNSTSKRRSLKKRGSVTANEVKQSRAGLPRRPAKRGTPRNDSQWTFSEISEENLEICCNTERASRSGHQLGGKDCSQKQARVR